MFSKTSSNTYIDIALLRVEFKILININMTDRNMVFSFQRKIKTKC